MTLAPWPKMKRSLPTNVQREFRGVNRLDPLTIDDRFSSDQENVTTADYPVMKTRPGYTVLGSTLPGRITGLYPWKNTELQATSNGTWYKYSGGSWGAVSGGTGFSTIAEWSFSNFGGGFSGINLIGMNGVNAPQRYDGSTVQPLTGAPAAGDFVDTFQDRVWCVSVQNGIKNQLNFSEFRIATNWTTTSGADSDPGFIIVEDNRGEPISGIHAGNSHMTIFKPNSIYELYGYNPNDFQLINVTQEVGLVSNQAWTTAKGIQYFVHTSGIYRYSGGTLPDEEFSRPVQEYVTRITPSATAKCCCGTDGVFVWFALPIDGSTENNILIEYNTEFGLWAVWRNFAPTHMTNVNGSYYIGGVEGQVRLIGGVTDNGVPISGYYTTKVFGAGSFAQKLRWKRAWANTVVPPGSTLTASLSGNADRTTGFTLAQNFPNSTELNANRVIIPTNAAYHSNYVTLRFNFTGPVTVKEITWEQDNLPAY